MPKLIQVLGVERSQKGRAQREVMGLYRTVQRPELFAGLVRTYRPVDDDGETLPPESKLVQYKVDNVLLDLRAACSPWWDSVATKEWGNTLAKADIVIDGDTILADVPVGFLLFLQKRLDDILEILRALPTLDLNEEWETDRGNGQYRSGTQTTIKTKKVPRAHILVEPTEHHPAQAETYHEDVKVGEWERILYSGAVPATRVDDLVRRTTRLRDAVIEAREQANTTEVTKHEVASELFTYLFG
jgi:hypothetical protein